MAARRPLVRSGATRELPVGDTLFAEGYAFPPVMVPSADPNTLDDYEEISFQPAFSFPTQPSGIAYGTRYGFATKIGRLVTIEGRIALTSKGLLGAGLVSITGLPFAASSLRAAGPFRGLNHGGPTGVLGGYVNGATIALVTLTGTGSTDFVWGSLANTTDLLFAATFSAG
jgi:hypothetical protein